MTEGDSSGTPIVPIGGVELLRDVLVVSLVTGISIFTPWRLGACVTVLLRADRLRGDSVLLVPVGTRP